MKINNHTFYKKRDLLGVVAVSASYPFAYMAGGEIGVLYCGLTMVHLIFLFMAMHSDKAFKVDVFLTLIPVVFIGMYFHRLAINASQNGTDTIYAATENVMLWIFMGVLPLFIHRAVHHILVTKEKEKEKEQQDNEAAD